MANKEATGSAPQKVTWEKQGTVAVVTMIHEDNRINRIFLEEFLDALDAIEADETITSLVVDTANEKIWSNGIDVEWVFGLLAANDHQGLKDFFTMLNVLLKRILTYPMPTVACIGGHVCAGGGIMACCFDFRFMRSDRGFFFFNEVDTGIPFWPGMVAICRHAIPEFVLTKMMLLGSRLSGPECEQYGIAMKALPKEELLPAAMAFAAGTGKTRLNYGAQKARLVAPIIKVMDEQDPEIINSGKVTA